MSKVNYYSERISDKEAIQTIEDYPYQDDFINRHLQQWLQNGEYCDNSIEMAALWIYCKSIFDNQQDNSREM